MGDILEACTSILNCGPQICCRKTKTRKHMEKNYLNIRAWEGSWCFWCRHKSLDYSVIWCKCKFEATSGFQDLMLCKWFVIFGNKLCRVARIDHLYRVDPTGLVFDEFPHSIVLTLWIVQELSMKSRFIVDSVLKLQIVDFWSSPQPSSDKLSSKSFNNQFVHHLAWLIEV